MFERGMYERAARVSVEGSRYAVMSVEAWEGVIRDIAHLPEESCPFGKTLSAQLAFFGREAAREGLAVDVDEGVVWLRPQRAPVRLTIEVELRVIAAGFTRRGLRYRRAREVVVGEVTAETTKGRRGSAIDWSAVPLGRAPDAELARQLGVTRELVRQARAARGIPVFEAGDDPPITENVELSDGFARVSAGLPPAIVLSVLLELGLGGLADVTGKGRTWVRRELGFVSPRALFSLAEALGEGDPTRVDRVGASRILADLVVGVCPNGDAFAGAGATTLLARVRAAWSTMAEAADLLGARSVVPREELLQAEATWPGAVGTGRTPGDAVRSAVLHAMRVPDQFGVDTQVARVLGIPVKGWAKSRVKPGAIDAMLVLCAQRGWILAYVPDPISGEDERWIAGDPTAFGIPALAPAVAHEIELRQNDGGGPKWLGVRCSCGWSEGSPGSRKERLQAAGRRHLRDVGVTDAAW